MRVIPSTNTRAVAALLDRELRRDAALERRVSAIVGRVRREGDPALLAYARKFDGLADGIEVSFEEMREGSLQVPRGVRDAISVAASNIRRVAARQVPRPWSVEPVRGVRIEQRVTPLERVGCYVPGGRYPLPSSLLMTAIPARIAGVTEIVAVCPRPDSTVMCAALEAGVTRLFRLGGAHAIAALAYGTASVPRVNKIVGPGNAYVAAAKALVSRDCAIDFFAGPSEIVIVSAAGKPSWIAADLIAQAEHDPDARAILITPARTLAAAVAREVARQLPASGPAARALASNGGIVLTKTMDEAIALSQRIAPEHVVCDTDGVARQLTCAGTVFVGDYSAQASGDYATGSNHVLPTSGAARGRGGLSAADFVRVSTVQRLTAQGLRRIAPAVISLAGAEGLTAHADSIRIRLPSRRQGAKAKATGGRRMQELQAETVHEE
jgi:histidinol dehydrogenase